MPSSDFTEVAKAPDVAPGAKKVVVVDDVPVYLNPPPSLARPSPVLGTVKEG